MVPAKNMTPAEKKREFIRLRAEGLSYRKIQERIKIGRSTCSRWEADLKDKISAFKAEQLESLYEEFSITRESRIKKLGTILNRLESEISRTDLSEVPADKLIELYLRYSKTLEEDYIVPNKPIDINEPNDLLHVLADLVNRLRSGAITEEQARRESTAINTMLKAYETIELKVKVEKLERMLLEKLHD